MGWIRCPRCELNYIKEDQTLCSICTQETKGAAPEEDFSELCIVCGERRSISGGDMCAQCMEEENIMFEHEDIEEAADLDKEMGVEPAEELPDIEEEAVEIPLEELVIMEKEYGDNDNIEENNLYS